MPQPSTDMQLLEIAMKISALSAEFKKHSEDNREDHIAMRTKLTAVDGTLRGNGEPGLVERVRRAEDTVKEIRAVKRWVVVAVAAAIFDVGVRYYTNGLGG